MLSCIRSQTKAKCFLTITFAHSRKRALGGIRATTSSPAPLCFPCENHPQFRRRYLSYILNNSDHGVISHAVSRGYFTCDEDPTLYFTSTSTLKKTLTALLPTDSIHRFSQRAGDSEIQFGVTKRQINDWKSNPLEKSFTWE